MLIHFFFSSSSSLSIIFLYFLSLFVVVVFAFLCFFSTQGHAYLGRKAHASTAQLFTSNHQIPQDLKAQSYNHLRSQSFEQSDIWSSSHYGQEDASRSLSYSARSQYPVMYSSALTSSQSTLERALPGEPSPQHRKKSGAAASSEEKSFDKLPSSAAYTHPQGSFGELSPQDDLLNQFKSSMSLSPGSTSTSSSERSSTGSISTIFSPRSSAGSNLSSVSSLASPLTLYSRFESRNSGLGSHRNSGTSYIKSGEESPSCSCRTSHEPVPSSSGERYISSAQNSMMFEGDEYSYSNVSDASNSFYSAPVMGTVYSSPVKSSSTVKAKAPKD